MRLILICVLASCAADPQAELNNVSIDQGVYGWLTTACDTGNCPQEPFANVTVNISAAGQTAVLATTKSDDAGVYSLALPAGDYQLCTFGCTAVTVPPSTKVRWDWEAGPGGGLWCDGGGC